MIPETAYDAAAESITQDDPRISPSDACDLAANALEAALPYLEVALRTQIATDIRADIAGKADYDHGLDDAARIVEEGAFHCCAHPKCPGGSICCCPDAEEGNTK